MSIRSTIFYYLRLQGVSVNKEKACWHSFESKNTAGTGPLNVSEPDNTQTCQSRGRVQTKHAVLQPMRADFQEQVVECGKVNDKESAT